MIENDKKSSSRKKILFVSENLATGGTTSALLSFLHEIDYETNEVYLQLYSNEGSFVKYLPKEIILLPPVLKNKFHNLVLKMLKLFLTLLSLDFLKFFSYHHKYRGTIKGNAKNIYSIVSLRWKNAFSKKQKNFFEVSIGFMEGWANYYVLSKKVKATKKIVWIHPEYSNSYLIKECDSPLLSKANKIVTVSNQCREVLKKEFPEYGNKIIKIDNIISKKLLSKKSNTNVSLKNKNKVNFCTVSRCDLNVKGLDRIVSALSSLRCIDDNFCWHYIGDGPDLTQLKQMIKKNNLDSNVAFYGNIDNPMPYLKQMDAFILASRYEGKPICVDEALMLGVPCIVTNYSSAKEQILDGENGLISNNDDASFVKMMLHYYTNISLMNHLHDGAEKFANNNSDAKEFQSVLVI